MGTVKVKNPGRTNAFEETGEVERLPRNPVRDAVDAVRTDITDRIDSLTSSVAEAGQNAKDAGIRSVDTTNRYVRSYPWHAVGIAVALGFVVGAVVSRR